MIACDTSVLSLFFRRAKPSHEDTATTVGRLIEDNRAALLSIVRQELLSGIREPEHFDRIRQASEAMPLFCAEDEDHTTAARFFNTCRTKGVQGSPVDFLICAMAYRREFPIFTTDPDFAHYARLIPIQLCRSPHPDRIGAGRLTRIVSPPREQSAHRADKSRA
jgi:predicted nucleic acid-binding protein